MNNDNDDGFSSKMLFVCDWWRRLTE